MMAEIKKNIQRKVYKKSHILKVEKYLYLTGNKATCKESSEKAIKIDKLEDQYSRNAEVPASSKISNLKLGAFNKIDRELIIRKKTPIFKIICTNT